jgi:hypothetical protein
LTVVAVLLACLTAALSLAIAITGGWRWRSAALQLSLRNPFPPLAYSAALTIGAWLLASPDERRDTRHRLLSIVTGPSRPFELASRHAIALSRAVVACTAAAVLLLCAARGDWIAGGADSSGYVSQARLWASGQLIIEQPYARAADWPTDPPAVVPLGYTLRPHASGRGDLVPVYSPGLPATMAVFEVIGGPSAVFVVVPLLGVLAIWCTYVLGTRVAGRFEGAAAAVLLAASPSFLVEVLEPVSDVPITAWWTCMLALLTYPCRGAALLAGLASSMATFTRPNTVPFALVPILHFLVVDARHAPRRFDRAALFAAGLLPGVITVAALYQYWYGSPLASGYGPPGDLYSFGYLITNISRYSTWMVQTQTPVIALVLGAPLIAGRRQRIAADQSVSFPATIWLWIGFCAVVIGSYVLYKPWDSWSYVRFLLPAFPPLLLLVVLVLRRLTELVTHRDVRGSLLAIALLVIVAATTFRFSVSHHLLAPWEEEKRYRLAGEYVRDHLPERAILISMQHSGSARYYSSRISMRYDLLPPERFESTINALTRLGYHPYFLLERWEEPIVRERFRSSPLGRIDWLPAAIISRDRVRLYDVVGAQSGSHEQRLPDVVD